MDAPLPPVAYRLLRAPAWTRDGDAVLIAHATGGPAVRAKAWTVAVLEGVAEGEPHAALRARAERATGEPRARADAALRHVLLTLHRQGVLDLVLPDAPLVLAGRYERVRELGRGGVGVAYLCRDLREPHAPPVVAKRAWAHYGPIERVEARLRDEAALLARLAHPLVVPRVDAFEEAGAFWLVRGFVDGEPMEALAGSGLVDPEARLAVARDVARVLAHLHARGLALVSVRPSNFHLVRGRPVLIDVGHGRALKDGGARLRSRHGSPGFTAPEVAREKLATPATDVWGLGRLLFFLATGEAPRPADRAADLVARLADARDAALVARLAADDPRDRPADGEAAEALLESA